MVRYYGSILSFFVICCSSAFSQTDSSFKPSGKLNAQFFMDYFYKAHASLYPFGISQYATTRQEYANFDIRRLFLGYNYDFSPSFTGEIMLSYEGNLDGSGNRGFLLKVADLKWRNILPNIDFVAGLQFTPSFPLLEEKIWGYRNVEKVLIDKNRLSVPTDLGVGFQGSFDDVKNYGFDVLYADGTATKPENDRYKKIYGDLWAKFFDKKIIVDLYGDLNQLKEFPQTFYRTGKLFAAYQTTPLTIGFEAVVQQQVNAFLTSANYYETGASNFTDVLAFGISLFASGEILEKKLNFFARYDIFNPDLSYDPTVAYLTAGYSTAKEHFFIFGLDWIPYPQVHISPNIWYTKYQNKLQEADGSYFTDFDLVPRLTFSYKY
jgi:hypothetical protein